MDKKKILIVGLILVIIASITLTIHIITKDRTPKNNTDNGIKEIKNDEVFKDRTIEGLTITDAFAYNNDDFSKFYAKLTNPNSSDYHLKSLYIEFTIDGVDEKVLALNDVTIPANDDTLINITFDRLITDITKIDYIIEK